MDQSADPQASTNPLPEPTLQVMPAARPRPGLHLALLLASFYTMVLAGQNAATGRLTALPEPSGLSYALCLIAILGAHEMGHYLYCRYYGIDASLPYFLPGLPFIGTFGAFIRIRAPFPNRRALFDVGVAGPIAGFVVLVPVLIYGFLHPTLVPITSDGGTVGEPLLFTLLGWWLSPEIPKGYAPLWSGAIMAGWVGCLATAMNLFPIGQLDGGHIWYSISESFHRKASLAGIAGFIALGLLVSPNWLFLATLLLFFGPRHPPVLEESAPLTRGRRLVAVISVLILILCFIPNPLPINSE